MKVHNLRRKIIRVTYEGGYNHSGFSDGIIVKSQTMGNFFNNPLSFYLLTNKEDWDGEICKYRMNKKNCKSN